MTPPNDPAQQAWHELWDRAAENGYKSELYAALETERSHLNEESVENDRTFEAPITRQDAIHGLYFEDALERAEAAAKVAVDEVESDDE